MNDLFKNKEVNQKAMSASIMSGVYYIFIPQGQVVCNVGNLQAQDKSEGRI